MREDFKDICEGLATRPVNEKDLALLREHAAATRKACRVSKAWRRNESRIVRETLDEVYERNRNSMDRFANARAKTVRDASLIMRHCILTLLVNDTRYYKETLLYWFRTIVRAFEFNASGLITDMYTTINTHTRRHMPAAEAGLLVPRVDEAREILTS